VTTDSAIRLPGGAPPGEHTVLARRVVSGDSDALAALYRQYHQDVRAFSHRLLGDGSLAEDLTHDTFMTLPRALKSLQSGASLRSFILGVAANLAKHYVRASMRRRSAMDRYGEHLDDLAEGASSGDPERARLVKQLVAALDQLPIEQRLAFVLCEVEERSSAEAAEILGVPAGTVRTRLMHGKRKLVAILGWRAPSEETSS
jgi:RNA polymerase sigma-70 factor (ECF subfamily)